MIDAHFGWKRKIRKFIDGSDIGITIESACNHKGCILGQWYYSSEGQALMNLPLMQELGEEHLQMHQLIGVIITVAEQDDYEVLESAVDKMDQQSDKVVELLHQLIEQTED